MFRLDPMRTTGRGSPRRRKRTCRARIRRSASGSCTDAEKEPEGMLPSISGNPPANAAKALSNSPARVSAARSMSAQGLGRVETALKEVGSGSQEPRVSQAAIAAISGLIPTMFMTRVRLYARTERAISAATFGRVLVRKCSMVSVTTNAEKRKIRACGGTFLVLMTNSGVS